MNGLLIDAFEFSRLKERREGQLPIAALPRLAKEALSDAGIIAWAIAGDNDHVGHPRLRLQIAGAVRLTCQRCLGPLDFDVSGEAVLILAKDEEQADQIDELLADDEIDVIVGAKSMSIAELVEDEALLAIPLSVRHDVCPDALPDSLDSLAADGKPSPFAILKDLKRR